MPGFDTNRFTDLNESLTKHLICSICMNIFDGAVRSGCEHTFCKSCVQQWIESNHTECPECRVKFETRKRSESTRSADNLVLIQNFIFKSHLLANSLVSDFTIKCDFEFNGCQQSMKLGSLSTHLKDCPHSLCAKCGFTFIQNIEHNCIELLKKDRNDLKDKYEKQLEINNKLEDNNRELKTKLDKEVSKNGYICESVESTYFGTFQKNLRCLEVYQDSFNLILPSNTMSTSLVHLKLPFNDCQQVMYCNEPSLRVILIKPISSIRINLILGIVDTNRSNKQFNVHSIHLRNRLIIIVFRADTQQFERCVQIMESVNNEIKVQAIDEEIAKCYIRLVTVNPIVM